ncbi:GNAT family protein [Stenotrophomonas sp. YIM B06876]|uniref:GNAT family N-acetyltransferase n=1 Tax=Stenotrophomonas sp. YIM B06876 TaxID=3060211 RepID=UPI002739CF01|nr:GNAT family protein [Stenotrophomonas sp. YIM B06876]
MNLADWTKVPTLDGRHARIEPLQMAHIEGLRGALGDGALSRLWYTQVPTAKTMTAYVQAALQGQAEGRMLPFAVLNADGEVVGTTRYYNLDTDVPRLSIGYTWYGQAAQRTGINTETKLMLLTHAFERLQCLSVGFETSWFNFASRAAIARLGAKQDGVLRNHKRHPDGTPRDTVIFSIIDAEWRGVKHHLQHRLDAHA